MIHIFTYVCVYVCMCVFELSTTSNQTLQCALFHNQKLKLIASSLLWWIYSCTILCVYSVLLLVALVCLWGPLHVVHWMGSKCLILHVLLLRINLLLVRSALNSHVNMRYRWELLLIPLILNIISLTPVSNIVTSCASVFYGSLRALLINCTLHPSNHPHI